MWLPPLLLSHVRQDQWCLQVRWLSGLFPFPTLPNLLSCWRSIAVAEERSGKNEEDCFIAYSQPREPLRSIAETRRILNSITTCYDLAGRTICSTDSSDETVSDGRNAF